MRYLKSVLQTFLIFYFCQSFYVLAYKQETGWWAVIHTLLLSLPIAVVLSPTLHLFTEKLRKRLLSKK